MIKYTSTRDASVCVDGSDAVIDVISEDGGLYVPIEFPRMDIAELTRLDYVGRADRVLKAFFDFDVSGVAKAAFSQFDADPAPITKLDDNMFVLELWHGKTHAAPDMSLAVLPRLMARAKVQKKDGAKTLVLVATAGDAGKAALEGFKDADGTEVCVFYPTDGVSAVQKLALQTQDGNNAYVAGVAGNFDDAQAAVKAAFTDERLRARLAENNITISSANSINIGRIVPQIAYYFSAYCDLVDSGEIRSGEKIDFVVPTGNFGSMIAGWYAVKMGLPVNRLVCASDRNNVLTDFISTGVYDINRELYKTDSPSMNALVSSNLERLIFETSGRNSRLTSERMEALKARGMYTVTPEEIESVHEIFAGDCVDEDEADEAIAQMDDEYGYLIDPHTAAAYAVAARREFVRPTVIVSVANPFKFAPAALRALTGEDVEEAGLDAIERLEDECAEDAPESLKKIFNAKIRFDTTVSPDLIADLIGAKYGKTERSA